MLLRGSCNSCVTSLRSSLGAAPRSSRILQHGSGLLPDCDLVTCFDSPPRWRALARVKQRTSWSKRNRRDVREHGHSLLVLDTWEPLCETVRSLKMSGYMLNRGVREA